MFAPLVLLMELRGSVQAVSKGASSTRQADEVPGSPLFCAGLGAQI
jgi:hypothetical protein